MSVDHREGESYPVQYSDAEWRKRLTPEQYRIMRQHGTEAPGSCALLREKRPGTFVCAGCGQPLFKADTKFESGTGWPSFNDPLPGSVGATEDASYGAHRGALLALRQPSRPRVPRWAAADRPALLHQRRGDQFPAKGRVITARSPARRAPSAQAARAR